jgi:tetratricopeptide (TPR) repeat protein
LRSRFVLNRIAGCEPPRHVDVLHCVRRVLKPRLPTVRLADVERELLSFYREGDIDGALIPAIYHGYLRGGDPQPLLSVLEHNDHDLVALAAIVAELCRHFERVVERDDPRDHLAYAKLAFRARDGERAVSFARAAIEGGGGRELERDAETLSARVAQRRGDVAAAVSAWQRVLELSRDEISAAQAHFALAKLYEHGLRDFAAARQHARFTLAVEGELGHGRRLGRLQRRLLSQ